MVLYQSGRPKLRAQRRNLIELMPEEVETGVDPFKESTPVPQLVGDQCRRIEFTIGRDACQAIEQGNIQKLSAGSRRIERTGNGSINYRVVSNRVGKRSSRAGLESAIEFVVNPTAQAQRPTRIKPPIILKVEADNAGAHEALGE